MQMSTLQLFWFVKWSSIRWRKKLGGGKFGEEAPSCASLLKEIKSSNIKHSRHLWFWYIPFVRCSILIHSTRIIYLISLRWVAIYWKHKHLLHLHMLKIIGIRSTWGKVLKIFKHSVFSLLFIYISSLTHLGRILHHFLIWCASSYTK